MAQATLFPVDGTLRNTGMNIMRTGRVNYRASAWDAATSSGLAYLNGELEKMDSKVREPLTSVTWQRDIVAKTGGGWVEFTSTFDMDYGTAGPNQKSIVASGDTSIPMMQVNTNKNMYKVFTFMHGMQVPFVDQAKLKQIGRNLEDLLDKGIRLNYNKTLDENVYTGFTNLGMTGLLNDPNVITALVEKGAGGKTTWKSKTPDEILQDINQALTDAWTASEYDLAGMPNHILIPPSAYSYITLHKVSEAGNVSIMKYLMENNIAKDQGVKLCIEPCRWCVGAGEGKTDRMMVYVNDEDKVNFDITVPLNRIMTQPSVERAAYITLYAAQIGQVKFNYYQPVRYYDGI